MHSAALLDAVALDLPGFGAAPPPPEPWGTPQYADALSPLLDELGPVVVLGHSFGGRVAIELAHRRPDAVRAPRAHRARSPSTGQPGAPRRPRLLRTGSCAARGGSACSARTGSNAALAATALEDYRGGRRAGACAVLVKVLG